MTVEVYLYCVFLYSFYTIFILKYFRIVSAYLRIIKNYEFNKNTTTYILSASTNTQKK